MKTWGCKHLTSAAAWTSTQAFQYARISRLAGLLFCAGVGEGCPVHFDVGSFVFSNDVSTGTTVHLCNHFQLMHTHYSRFMTFQNLATSNFLVFEELRFAFGAFNGQHLQISLIMSSNLDGGN